MAFNECLTGCSFHTKKTNTNKPAPAATFNTKKTLYFLCITYLSQLRPFPQYWWRWWWWRRRRRRRQMIIIIFVFLFSFDYEKKKNWKYLLIYNREPTCTHATHLYARSIFCVFFFCLYRNLCAYAREFLIRK